MTAASASFIPHAAGITLGGVTASLTKGMSNAVERVENLQYIHKIFQSITPLLEMTSFGRSLTFLRQTKEITAVTDVVLNAAQFFPFFHYYTHKQEGGVERFALKEGVASTVKQAKTELQKGRTSFGYHLVAKPQLAVAMTGFCAASFCSVLELLEAFRIPLVAACEKGLGLLPLFGDVLAANLRNGLVAFGSGALVLATGGLVVDSLRYIHHASYDTRKDMTKGIIQLVARVSYLAFATLLALQVSGPLLCLAGLATGLAGVSSVIYQAQKRELDNKDLKKLLHTPEQQNV